MKSKLAPLFNRTLAFSSSVAIAFFLQYAEFQLILYLYSSSFQTKVPKIDRNVLSNSLYIPLAHQDFQVIRPFLTSSMLFMLRLELM